MEATRKKSALSVNMTEGSLWKNMLLFSLPLMLTQVLEVLFNLSDVAIAGKFADYRALGAVGSTTLLVSLFTGLLIGMGSGVNVAVARGLGMGDKQRVEKTVHTSFVLCAAFGVVLCLICVLLARPMLALLHTKDELMDGAVLYLKIYALSMPAMAVYNCGNGIMSAVGDTRRPLLYLSIAGVLNVVLNLFFVIRCHMAAEGVAIASAIAQWVSAILIMLHLMHRKDCCRIALTKLRFHRLASKRVLLIGVPITLSNSAMSIINIIDTKIVMGRLQNGLGLSETAAAVLNGQYRIAMNMPNMVASFVYPVTMSLIPFAAAALARKDHAEADRIISSAFRLIAILALPAGVGLSVLSTPIERLMLPMQPEDALAAGPHLQILGIALIFICLMILTNAILQTYGKENLPIFTVIAGGVVKVVMNYILVGNPDISIHGAPISTLCCYLTICGLNLFFVWKYSPEKPRYTRLFGKPIVASAVMGAAAWAVYGLVARVLSGHSAYGANALATFCGILAGVVVYGVLVITLRILQAEDVKALPKGEKIAKLLRLK